MIEELEQQVRGLAAAQGFGLCGLAEAEPSAYQAAVRQWIDAGRHGSMQWLAEHLEVRLDPQQLLPGVRSVIAVADAYSSAAGGAADERLPVAETGPRGRIARYAWGDDYHKVLKKRLHTLADALRETYPTHEFRVTVDTAPALEREHAARAGLGWQAKNTMLIHPRHGSYTLLGLILTTLELADASAASGRVQPTDHCANCTRCIDACPTQAIAPAGYQIDASRCVSYLTLEHRGPIDPALQGGMQDWLAGCDICQEVCPYNAVAARHPLPVLAQYAAAKRGFDQGLDLLEVLQWSAEDRQRAVQGSAVKRVKRDMFRRNALIALGNRLLAGPPREDWRQAIERCCDDPSELVCITARQVLERLDAVVPAA